MKKWLLVMLAFAALILSPSCSKEYDDSDVISRLEAIEDWISELESDVQTIQSLILALEANVYVSEVNALSDGYQIVFSDGQTVTISDGISTEIAVVEEDGIFYWTLNGEPITDSYGNKIQASADTPYIQDGNWWIGSIDTGVQAQGSDGTSAAVWTIGDDGYWYKDGVKTQYKAVGEDGATGTTGPAGEDGSDADVWTIGDDGYWYKNDVKTEYKAVGTDGADGADGADGTNGTNGTNGSDGSSSSSPISVTVNEDGTVTIKIASTGAVITLPMSGGFVLISGLDDSTNGTYSIPANVISQPVVISLPIAEDYISAIQVAISGSGTSDTEIMTRVESSWDVTEPVITECGKNFQISLKKDAEEESSIILKAVVINTSGEEFTKSYVIKVAPEANVIYLEDTQESSLTIKVMELLDVADPTKLTDEDKEALAAINGITLADTSDEYKFSELDLKLIGYMTITDLVVNGLNSDLITACKATLETVKFTDSADFTSLGEIEGLKESVDSIKQILEKSSCSDLISLLSILKSMSTSTSDIPVSRASSTVDTSAESIIEMNSETAAALTAAIASIQLEGPVTRAEAGSTQYGYTTSNAVNTVTAAILNGTLAVTVVDGELTTESVSAIETALQACSMDYIYYSGFTKITETVTFSDAMTGLGNSISTYVAEVKSQVEDEFDDLISDVVSTVAVNVLNGTTEGTDAAITSAVSTAAGKETSTYSYQIVKYSSIAVVNLLNYSSTTAEGTYALAYYGSDYCVDMVQNAIGAIFAEAASGAVSSVSASIIAGTMTDYTDGGILDALKATDYEYTISSSFLGLSTTTMDIDCGTAIDYMVLNDDSIDSTDYYVDQVNAYAESGFQAVLDAAIDSVYGEVISSVYSLSYSDDAGIAAAIEAYEGEWSLSSLWSDNSVDTKLALSYLGTTAADQAAIVKDSAYTAFTNAYNAAISSIGSSIANGITSYDSDSAILILYQAYTHDNDDAFFGAELINAYYAYTSLGYTDLEAADAARAYSESEYGYVGTVTLALYEAALSNAVTTVSASVIAGLTSNDATSIKDALLAHTLIYNVSDILTYYATLEGNTITIDSLYAEVAENVSDYNTSVSDLTESILGNYSFDNYITEDDVRSAVEALDTIGMDEDQIDYIVGKIMDSRDSSLAGYYDTTEELTAIVEYIYNTYVGDNDVDKIEEFSKLTADELTALVDSYRLSQTGLALAYSLATDTAKATFTSTIVSALQATQSGALEDYIEDYFDNLGNGEIDSWDDLESLIDNLTNLADGDIDEIDDIMSLVSTALAYADDIEFMLSLGVTLGWVDQDTYDTVMEVIEIIQTVNDYYEQASDVIEQIEDALGVDLSNLEAAFLSTTTTVVNELFSTVYTAAMEVALSGGEVTDYIEAIVTALIEVGLSDEITDELLNLFEVMFDTSLDVAEAGVLYVAAYLEEQLTEIFSDFISDPSAAFEDSISTIESAFEDAISYVSSIDIDDLTLLSALIDSIEGLTTKSGGSVVVSDFAGFAGYTNLRSVTGLPSTLVIVGNSAFENTSLTSIELPESVKAIGSRAFADCEYLKSVTSTATQAPLLVPAIEVKEFTVPFFVKEVTLVVPVKIEVDTFEGVSGATLSVPAESIGYKAIEITPSISIFSTCGEYSTASYIESVLSNLDSTYTIDTQWSKIFSNISEIAQ